MWPLSLAFGAVIGFSLGLTGGGGSLFAVPLLVYGLGIGAREAVGISLAAVGMTSLVGALDRLRARQVEFRTATLFAVAGIAGAPLGSWLAGLLPEALLLFLFALLMLGVAARLALTKAPEVTIGDETADGPTCRRDPEGNLHWTSQCALLLATLGFLTGVLSGLFGVGGGFVIVPVLVLYSGMAIHRAVGTSLLVITLISISGVTSHLLAGREIPLDVTALFVAGGIAGLQAGKHAARRLAGPALQKLFALAIVGVAVFVLVRSGYP